jgi:hypothetical protein
VDKETGGWVERFNSGIRGAVTLALTLTFCYLAIRSAIDGNVFSNVVSTVLGFWFAAKAAERMMEKAPLPPGTTTEVKTTTPPIVTVTTPSPPVHS